MVDTISRFPLLKLFVVIFSSVRFQTGLGFSQGNSNCGQLLVGLTSSCASVKYSQLETCCEALRKWNDGLCWCERNALTAASNLAMDPFAFQFRAEICQISPLYHREITLPSSAGKTLPSTCPHSISDLNASLEENCNTSSPISNLRMLRLQALQVLSGSSIGVATRQILEWSKRMDAILSPEVSLMSIGLTFSYPRIAVKEYLLYRSKLSNGAQWQSTIDVGSVIWKGSQTVSYITSLKTGPFSFGRTEFVTFETCSPQIKSVFVQEEHAVRLFKQFVYVEPSDTLFWNIHRSPQARCRMWKQICGNMFSFHNEEECIVRQRSMFSRSKVTCSKGSKQLSTTATHGESLSCYNMLEVLAQITPHKYCRALGPKGIGRCRYKSCANTSYNDIFSEENPRYEISLGYTCSREKCTENWPGEKS